MPPEDLVSDYAKGIVIALGPEDGESFWQPLPSTGYVINKINPYNSPTTHSRLACRCSSLAHTSGAMPMSAATSCCSAIAALGKPTLMASYMMCSPRP